MEPRRLGQSDLYVSPVIFGAWAVGGWFWGGARDEDSIDAIRAAIDAGVTAVDTAPIYGRGHSERVVGRALRGYRDQVQVMTKVGLRWEDDRGVEFFRTQDPDGAEFTVFRNLRPDSVRFEVERSLARLGVDTIDLLQCHWPDPSTPVADTMGALIRLHEEGKIRAIGVSNFDVPLLEQARDTLRGAGLGLASNQPPFSLLNRDIRAEILPWCRQHHVGTLAYSPMERGLLTGKVGLDRVFAPSDGRSTDPRFSLPRRRKVLRALARADDIAHELDCTLAQLAVAWVIHHPGLTAALVGARDRWQAEQAAAAGDVHLGPEHLQALEAIFADL